MEFSLVLIGGHEIALLTVAVCCKPEGHGFVPDEVIGFFSIKQILNDVIR
jgi:hypothetical protein